MALPTRDRIRGVTQRLLRRARTGSTLLRLLTSAFRHTTTRVAQLPERPPVACAPGCTFCCYQPVDITPPEALAIVAYLRRTLPDAPGGAAVYTRLAAQAERIRALSYTEHARARMPCALLQDGRCLVYPVRPFACRAWTSTSAAVCETIWSHGDPITRLPPLDMGIYEAVWEVAHGITEGLTQARLDAQAYELHSLVQCVVATPDAASRWRKGEAVFVGCLVGAFPR